MELFNIFVRLKVGFQVLDGFRLEASWAVFGAAKSALEWLAGRSNTNFKTGFSHLGGQKVPKRDPKKVQN